MCDVYLGDSYDLVKRFWSESLRSVGPLYAYSRFVPADIRVQYTAVTSIPILDTDNLPRILWAVARSAHWYSSAFRISDRSHCLACFSDIHCAS